jgi:hypothetical protein
MKYSVEMGSGAYIPSFIKTGSTIQKLIGGIHSQHGDRISLLSFFKIRKVGLKEAMRQAVSSSETSVNFHHTA